MPREQIPHSFAKMFSGAKRRAPVPAPPLPSMAPWRGAGTGALRYCWSRRYGTTHQRSIQHRTFRHFSLFSLLPIPAAPHCPARPRLLAALSPVSDRRHRDPALPVIRSRRPSASSPNNNSGRSRSQILSRRPDHSTTPSSRCRCDACLIVNTVLLCGLCTRCISSATRSF